MDSLNARARTLSERQSERPQILLGSLIWLPLSRKLADTFENYVPLCPHLLDGQRDLTSRMRHILADWIVDVCEEYRLGPRILFLSIDIVDRVLSLPAQVTRGKLQLLGIAAMLTASDLVLADEDDAQGTSRATIISPTHEEMRYISDDTYAVRDIAAEHERISAIISPRQTDRSKPTKKHATLYTALVKFAADVPHALPTLRVILHAQRVAELALMRAKMLKYRPSLLAVACVVRARYETNLCAWDDAIEDATGYFWKDVQPCLSLLIKETRRASSGNLRAVRVKYDVVLEQFCSFRHSHLVYMAPPASVPLSAVIDYRTSDGRHCVLEDRGRVKSTWMDLSQTPFVTMSSAASAHALPKPGDKVLCSESIFSAELPRNAIVKKIHRDGSKSSFCPPAIISKTTPRETKSAAMVTVTVEYASPYVSGVVEKGVSLERIRFYEWTHATQRPPLVSSAIRKMIAWVQCSTVLDDKRDAVLKNSSWTKYLADRGGNEDAVPSELCCPITSKLMVDPVVASDGFTYERIAILRWMSEHTQSPMTRHPFEDRAVRSNRLVSAQASNPLLLVVDESQIETSTPPVRKRATKTALDSDEDEDDEVVSLAGHEENDDTDKKTAGKDGDTTSSAQLATGNRTKEF
eukprot:g5208.t1